jgi:hypothetical protein
MALSLIKDNYVIPSGTGDTWQLKFTTVTRPVKSYWEEINDMAEYMYANKTGKIHLLYSGGMDSEFVFNLFLEKGFEFTPVIIQLTPDYNNHDIKYALDFCESKCITPVIYKIDFDNFVKSGKIIDIAKSVQCSAYQIPTTMFVAGQLDGFVVMGDCPPYIRPDPITKIWSYVELEKVWSILKYFEKNNLDGCPWFLSWSPELLLSYLQDPIFQALADNKILGKLGSNSSKIHVYNRGNNFNIPNRTKYTGYEHIETCEIFKHENITIFNNTFDTQWGGTHSENYHSLIKKLQVI